MLPPGAKKEWMPMRARRRVLWGGAVLLVAAAASWVWQRQSSSEAPAQPREFLDPMDCARSHLPEEHGPCSLLHLSHCDALSVFALDPDDPVGVAGSGDGTIGLGSLRDVAAHARSGAPAAPSPVAAPEPENKPVGVAVSDNRTSRIDRMKDSAAHAGTDAPAAPSQARFPSASVLAQRTLEGASAYELLASWRAQILGHGMNMCFTPYYGMSCSVGGKVVAEWEICFACEEIRYRLHRAGVQSSSESSGTRTIRFNPRTPEATRLRSLLTRALPHPSAALFEKMHKMVEVK
jgi:hypothetical protein